MALIFVHWEKWNVPDDPAYEEVVFIDKAKRYYKKCIIHNDRLIGAILIGDKSEFLEYRDLIENKMELSEKRLQLLRSGKAFRTSDR